LLASSYAVVSLWIWCDMPLVGFWQTTSDGFSLAVLGDNFVAGDHQGHG
jgi:hypothetical protein